MTHPSFWQAFKFWLKMGFVSFGGPAGQIAILHEELVERKKWVSEERFLHALNYCMLLPGPEAQQLCIYIGWLLHKTWGGIVAGSLFVLPSLFLLTFLSWLYVNFGKIFAVNALMYGLKCSVLALVLAALLRIGQKALKNKVMFGLALFAFIGIYFLQLPFPLIVLGAGLLGYFGGKFWPDFFYVINSHGKAEDSLQSGSHHHTHTSFARTAKILLLGMILWLLPLFVFNFYRGSQDIFTQQAWFFSKAALVTFGGAYAVLPYIAQAGVQTYGCLSASQMMDGLGLAETTPGPLIMVVTFIGYVGAYQHSGLFSPPLAGIMGGLIATYFTFMPCFLWIFLGAPYIEKMRKNIQLSAALSAITAAVVGVILNLSVFFGKNILWEAKGHFDFFAAFLAFLVFMALHRWKLNVIYGVLSGALIGLIYQWILGTTIK